MRRLRCARSMSRRGAPRASAAGMSGVGLRRLAIPLLILAAFSILASCQKPLTVLLGPEAAPLKAAIEETAAGTQGLGKVMVEVEGAKAPAGSMLRLSSTPGWNLPSGSEPAVSFPSDWDPSYRPPPAFAVLGQGKDHSWSSVPLLYDVWGHTTFAANPSAPTPAGEWKGLLKRAAPASLSVAGIRPSFRQAAYLFGIFPDLPSEREAASWFVQAPSGWKAPGAVLPALVADRAWIPNSWFFSREDQAMSYKTGKPIVFFETYRDYERANPRGVRRFVPLTIRKGQSYAMAGTVLFLEFRGNKNQLGPALKLMRSLARPEFQKRAGMDGKWLSADQSAPELDGVGAMVRRMSRGASRFFPVTDRLPAPLVEGSLWVEVQLSVDRAPRKQPP
jgi:hypothetical protein